MKLADKNHSRLIIGVDEAGRGPVLGPLIVGGFATFDEPKLRGSGIRDSKQITPKRRAELFQKLPDLGFCETVSLEAEDLDALRSQMSLNRIEARLFASALKGLISKLQETGYFELTQTSKSKPPTVLRVFLDAADANATAFGNEVKGRLFASLGRQIPVEVVSEHKADERYPVVGAASILAKVTRDRAIQELEKGVGQPIGSGYPSDPVTQGFIKDYFGANGTLPPGTRQTWKTVDRLLRPQASLDRYLSRGDES